LTKRKTKADDLSMRTISVREMKAHWAEVESQVQDGETFEVVNRGKPSVRILPARPQEVSKWDDHLLTAAKSEGLKAEQAILEDRYGRW
jgi:prevent-host-death family protein